MAVFISQKFMKPVWETEFYVGLDAWVDRYNTSNAKPSSAFLHAREAVNVTDWKLYYSYDNNSVIPSVSDHGMRQYLFSY